MAVGGSDSRFVEKRVSVICSQRRKSARRFEMAFESARVTFPAAQTKESSGSLAYANLYKPRIVTKIPRNEP